uniref:Uncharacterized protein n=1 Tax=Mola mola TaxID=94237 RepID=A0A3Q3WRF0_MOLML
MHLITIAFLFKATQVELHQIVQSCFYYFITFKYIFLILKDVLSECVHVCVSMSLWDPLYVPPSQGTHTVTSAQVHCFYVNNGPRFYRDLSIDYYGVEADDAVDFILSPFFYPTARYIRAALAMGEVFLLCLMGVSCSATLLLEALTAVRPHRDICPNPGFLQQLRGLNMSLEG